ncbi:hypothetical protein DNL40_11875 [Xylanimonas oleitrophica]|uniref:Amino acid adenylation domain-containing protein n=1 Tax=Xylanimonas oleitrophica TaxID=2607479 RepID=A0A2W5WLB8_9MICO|nr:AMP-binding protein [Xylanimonas oleitrophica]PZR52369.1 hypothetical protein DNL40_11875 [Xylanimonas oleitrophica]
MTVQEGVGSVVDVAAAELGLDPAALRGSSLAQLGRSSLDAARLAVALFRATRVRLAPVELLGSEDLAATLEHAQAAPEPESRSVASPADGDLLPLTWQQRLIWFQQELEPGAPTYLFHALLRFDAPPVVGRLRRALARALERHPVMRTHLVRSPGDVRQRVVRGPVDPAGLPWTEVELPVVPPDSRALVEAAAANRPFDVESDLLVRWTLLYLPDGSAVLVHTEHHLVHDGMSFTSFLRSVAEADAGEPAPEELGYFDHARSARPPAPEALEAAVAELAGAGLAPFTGRGCTEQSADLGLRIPVPAPLFQAVERRAREIGVSTFTAFFAAFTAAMAAHRRGDRFVVGTGMANRPLEHLDTVGMFVSMVPVVVDRPRDDAVAHVMATRAALERAEARSDVPLQELVRALGPAVRGGNALLSTGFSLFEQTVTTLDIAGSRARLEVGPFTGSAKFPLDCVLVVRRAEDDTDAELLVEGSAAAVGADDMWALWTAMLRWLTAFAGLEPAAAPPAAVSAVVTAAESVACAHPDRVAFADDTEAVQYGRLPHLGMALAELIGERRRIGLLGGGSAAFFAAAYAVARTGGTYVPLPHDQPVARLAAMVAAAGCDVVVALPGCLPEASAAMAGVPVYGWDQITALADSGVPAGEPVPSALPAYVMFTSGSTGVPRGVEVPRHALDARAGVYAGWCSLGPDDVVAQWSSVGFDASVLELWPALLAGAELRVVPTSIRTDPFALVGWLASTADVAFVSASVADLLGSLQWPDTCRLRVLTTGAEPLHPLVRELPFEVRNMYGPTEVTIVATSCLVDVGSTRVPPIGAALPGVVLRIVGEDGREVPDGEPGELWVGGPDIAAGYAGDTAGTDARFVPDPYGDGLAVVYRTGDVVRRRPGGDLEFLGRRDRQTKVNGVRIEPVEVEASVLAVPGVRAVALAAGPEGTAPVIVVVPDTSAEREQLVAAVRAVLVPQLRHLPVRFTNALPVTPSGKVSHAALADLLRVEDMDG